MRRACGIVSLVIIGFMLACIFWGSPLAIWHMERDLRDYLSESGCQSSEIISLDGHYDPFAEIDKKYYVVVVLAGKPETSLVFHYDQAGHIQQSGS